jgi:dienelactone hydrolase
MNGHSDYFNLPVGDGTEMLAYVARPRATDNAPGIFVFQEALGVNSQLRGVADRYAKLGFVAIAPDLAKKRFSGSGACPVECSCSTPRINR